jgi:phosphoribosylaminoimidazolecarboxamide formyltransferase/IMP cyclohydrolase
MSDRPGRIRRALVSVSDKRGLPELGRALVDAGIDILSTGGSAACLREHDVPVLEVSEYTGFPEIMGGRVKTLHPRIHGGILARPDADDADAAEHGIEPIDLVVVNLYPFADAIARDDCSFDDGIEHIDVGGPAMLRAAAKNHERVTVLCRPDDYPALLETLPEAPGAQTRRRLAARAFAHTADYDGQISAWMGGNTHDQSLPRMMQVGLELVDTLRYGENPHQAAGLYADRRHGPAGLAAARRLQGKPLSYNNLLDADAAWRGVATLGDEPACVIVKHNNPCGAATAATPADAWRKALACDPQSAFGGIVAFNRDVDRAAAEAMDGVFTEVVVAPDFEPAALEVLSARNNLRVLAPTETPGDDLELRRIEGGWLVQVPDRVGFDRNEVEVATERTPDESEWRDLAFAWRCAALVRSNAIVLARDGATLGIGAGQMSRVDAVRIALMKAADRDFDPSGSCLASDAFFPFADGLEAAAAAGVRAVIQPGGSKRDSDVVAAADRHGIAMVFTRRRHFRH